MKKTLNLDGVPITVVTDAEAEEADYVVCMPDGPTHFTDNFKGFCCRCGRAVMYRWHAPRLPKKICLECVLKERRS